MPENEDIPFTIDQLRDDADKAWSEILPWMKIQVRRKVAQFRLDNEQVDDVGSRIIEAIRKKVEKQPTAFANVRKLQAYVSVSAGRLALKVLTKARRVREISAAERDGEKELLQASIDQKDVEDARYQDAKLLAWLESAASKYFSARELEVFRMMKDQATGQEMAEALGTNRNAAYQAKNRLRRKCARLKKQFARLEELGDEDV